MGRRFIPLLLSVTLAGCSSAAYTRRLATLRTQYESGQLTSAQYQIGQNKILASQKRTETFNKTLDDFMKVALIVGVVGLAASAASQGGGGTAYAPSTTRNVYVPGYYRSDGTYVRPHIRSAPDNVVWNNYGPSTDLLQLNNPYLRDWDGDGVANYFDFDDDNDGLLDDYDPVQYGY